MSRLHLVLCAVLFCTYATGVLSCSATLNSPTASLRTKSIVNVTLTAPQDAKNITLTIQTSIGNKNPVNLDPALDFSAGKTYNYNTTATASTTFGAGPAGNSYTPFTLITAPFDATYTFTFSLLVVCADDSNITRTSTGVIVDMFTETPTLNTPIASASFRNAMSFVYTIPEAFTTGSVDLYVQGTTTSSSNFHFTLLPLRVGADPTSFNWDVTKDPRTAVSTYISAATGLALDSKGRYMSNGWYTVTLTYQDSVGNPTKTATATQVFFDFDGQPTVSTVITIKQTTTQLTNNNYQTTLASELSAALGNVLPVLRFRIGLATVASPSTSSTIPVELLPAISDGDKSPGELFDKLSSLFKAQTLSGSLILNHVDFDQPLISTTNCKNNQQAVIPCISKSDDVFGGIPLWGVVLGCVFIAAVIFVIVGGVFFLQRRKAKEAIRAELTKEMSSVKINQSFGNLDANHDGFLNMEEFKKAMAAGGPGAVADALAKPKADGDDDDDDEGGDNSRTIPIADKPPSTRT